MSKSTNILLYKQCKCSNPGQWYSKLKRMSNYDQIKAEQVIVEEISNLSNLEQAEIIADNFSKISNQYDPIDPDKIARHTSSSKGNNKATPIFEPHEVYEYLKRIKTNTATIKGDIPAKIVKEFAPELSEPLANILNCMVERGEFPNLWKLEMVTPFTPLLQ